MLALLVFVSPVGLGDIPHDRLSRHSGLSSPSAQELGSYPDILSDG